MRYSLAAALLLFVTACVSGSPLRPTHLSMAARNAPERLILVTVANPSSPVPSRAGSTPHGYDGFTVYGTADSARATATALAKDYALQEVGAWPIAQLHVHCIVYAVAAENSRADVLARLLHDARVKLAEPMQTFDTLGTYNDPYVELQHGLTDIDVAEAHRWSQGEGIRVAVIDTGVATDHPDLRGRVIETHNFVDRDAAQFKRDWHGTQVAGVIAAVANNREGIVGVAPAVHLIALKACWQMGTAAEGARCNSFTLAQALSVALEESAQIINLSLSGPPDPLLSAIIQQGIRRGAIFVGASPAVGGATDFPSSNAGVLAVDAAESPGVASVEHLHAPGREILTLTPDGHYDFVSGPSFATAHVTGTVALLLAQNSKLSAPAIYQLLSQTTGFVSTHAGQMRSINACAALAALGNEGECKSEPKSAQQLEPRAAASRQL